MPRRYWTPEETEILVKNWRKIAPERIAEMTGHTVGGVENKAHKMGLGAKHPKAIRHNCPWTEEEKIALEEMWARLNARAIAKSLGRTVDGVSKMATALHLGTRISQVDGISAYAIYRTCVNDEITDYVRFFERHGLKLKHLRGRKTQKIAYVDLRTFWRWARRNVGCLNLEAFAEGALGPEPRWMREARAARAGRITKKFWTAGEDAALLREVASGRYTEAELADLHKRSAKAIRRRLERMGSKLRPPLPESGPRRLWRRDELEELERMTRSGWHVDAIARKMGRTVASVAAKVHDLKKSA